MPDATRWRTRTKELRYVKPGELADHPLQHRLHAPEQRAHLVGILDEIGIAGGLLAWYSARNGGALTAIDGHLRKSLDQDQPWPTIITDLDDREADLLLLAYDWIGAQAQSGQDELQRLLGQVQPQTAAVQVLQAAIAEQAGIPWGPQGPDGGLEDDEAPTLRANELMEAWGTAKGQLWEIPSAALTGPCHRLLCGDSTEAEDVHRLMQGRQAVMCATDPPYLVDYTGERGAEAGKDWTAVYHEVEITDGRGFFLAVFTNVLEVLAPHAAIYCWHAHKRYADILAVWQELGIHDHQQIIWVKPTPVFGHAFWHFRHEPCLMGWRKGSMPPHDGDQSLNSVWECDWAGKARIVGNDHPTEKPVELFARPMRKHTKPGDVCYEPFAGSGTQLIAAERTGRLCYAMEIEPAFVAVDLERCKMLGLEPRLVEAT